MKYFIENHTASCNIMLLRKENLLSSSNEWVKNFESKSVPQNKHAQVNCTCPLKVFIKE